MSESARPIFMTTHSDWDLWDFTGGKQKEYVLPAGRYEVERIPCPIGFDCTYLVLKGTKIGAAEGFLRQWAPKGERRDDDIEFEE